MIHDFLPVSRQDMKKRGIEQLDFVYISGDAYVDHPSFGHAIITRMLESQWVFRRNHCTAGLERQKQCGHSWPSPSWFSGKCWKYGFHGKSLYSFQKSTGKQTPILQEASWENDRTER